MKKVKITNIIELLEKFTKSKINGKYFERKYMQLWKYLRDKDVRLPQNIQKILDEIWCDVDAFVSDKKLLSEIKNDSMSSDEHIDEKELKKRVKKNLMKVLSKVSLLKRFIINGKKLSNIKGFYNEVQRILTDDFNGFGRNLDAFDDILYGGFGKFDDNESIILIWKNFDKSKNKLPSEFLKQVIDIIKHHKNIKLELRNGE